MANKGPIKRRNRRRDYESIDRGRKEAGLRKQKRMQRQCLKCGKMFESGGIENRICETCKIRFAKYYHHIDF